MDNDYPVDVEEILRVVRTADVIVFRFLILSQRLLVDPRVDAATAPLLRLVAPVGSAEERFRSLKRLRPGLPSPARITVIHWPKFIDKFEASGIWEGITARMTGAGLGQHDADEVVCELRRLEHREVQHALRGDGYQTLWAAS